MRDPLVTPEPGDVIEGREGDSVYRWTVESVDGGVVRGRVTVTTPDVDDDEMGAVTLEEWRDWSNFTDVRVAAEPRDPLVDPEPGDVVRAKDGATGERVVFVVSRVSGGDVSGAVANVNQGGASAFVYTLKHWRDWSAWTDVAVLS